jgi:coenzyme F420-0:L-glutamate ligase / coenzyme F420-1:gamma-L-glutamate ligase
MDLHEFLRTRRSVRRFKPNPVPDAVLQRILVTATYAPSAHHRQPWRFAILTSMQARARLAEAMAVELRRDFGGENLSLEDIDSRVEKSRQRITTSPIALLLCVDISEMDMFPDSQRRDAERSMAIQSAAAAGLQLLLAAHAEGLGGVWACWPLFTPEMIEKTLDLPEAWEPQALIFLGYPATIPEARERLPLQTISITR